MCLEILDPCKICQFVSQLLCFFTALFALTYTLKGWYLYGGNDEVRAIDVIQDPKFFEPEGDFWLFVLASLVFLTIVLFLLKGLKTMLREFYSRVCCCDDYITREESLRRRNRQREEGNKRMGQYYKLARMEPESSSKDKEELEEIVVLEDPTD